jgi:hypothetical protein
MQHPSLLKKLFFACAVSLVSAQAMAAITYSAWPNSTPVVVADGSKQFGGNLSGLLYEPAVGTQKAVLWAVQNGPSKLYNMVWNGSIYVKNTANGWSAGKTLVYPNGAGVPDAEGVTKAELSSTAIYVSTERNDTGSSSVTPRFSVLRYDTSSTATTLTATHEWNLTPDLPIVTDSNAGLEAIAWLPDSYLQAKGFIDETDGLSYNPANYPSHGTGLFFVGLEKKGVIYAYALNEANSTYTRVATIASGQTGIMDLSFDRDNQVLWAYCDNNCSNRSTLLAIDTVVGSATKGKFIVRKAYNKAPSVITSGMNNEGIAIAPASECTGTPALKSFFWTDDSESNSHSIRRGKIPCAPLF